MKETKNIYICDDKQWSSIPDADPVRDLVRPGLVESFDQEKGKKMLTIKKVLPDDHLTGTYWG